MLRLLSPFLKHRSHAFQKHLTVNMWITNHPYLCGDSLSISGLGRSLGEGNGNPLQYSCLDNPMDRGAWWATVHGNAKSQTWLSDQTTTNPHLFRKQEIGGLKKGAKLEEIKSLPLRKSYPSNVLPSQTDMPNLSQNSQAMTIIFFFFSVKNRITRKEVNQYLDFFPLPMPISHFPWNLFS